MWARSWISFVFISAYLVRAWESSQRREFRYPSNESCWTGMKDCFYCCDPDPALGDREDCFDGGFHGELPGELTYKSCCYRHAEEDRVVGYPGNPWCFPEDLGGLTWQSCCHPDSLAIGLDDGCWMENSPLTYDACCYRSSHAAEYRIKRVDKIIAYPGDPSCWEDGM